MKKKAYVLGVAVALAALLALAGVAQSAMWVGAELGGNFIGSTSFEVNGTSLGGNTEFSPSVIGGAAIGYDFVNYGFGAYNWPDWMKYFSIVTDITYNRLNINSSGSGIPVGRVGARGVRFALPEAAGLGTILPAGSRLSGSMLVWSWLLYAHYGFFPDSVVPTGRVVPFVGVGPGIAFTSVDAGSLGLGSRSQTNIALVVDAGVRWMCLSNVSIDTLFRFRHLKPSYEFTNVNFGTNTLDVPISSFSFLVRANYHF